MSSLYSLLAAASCILIMKGGYGQYSACIEIDFSQKIYFLHILWVISICFSDHFLALLPASTRELKLKKNHIIFSPLLVNRSDVTSFSYRSYTSGIHTFWLMGGWRRPASYSPMQWKGAWASPSLALWGTGAMIWPWSSPAGCRGRGLVPAYPGRGKEAWPSPMGGRGYGLSPTRLAGGKRAWLSPTGERESVWPSHGGRWWGRRGCGPACKEGVVLPGTTGRRQPGSKGVRPSSNMAVGWGGESCPSSSLPCRT